MTSPCRHREVPLPQSPMRLTKDLLLSVSDLVTFWARKATQALSRKDHCEWDGSGSFLDSARKRGRRPAKRLLLSNISSKVIRLVMSCRRRKDTKDGEVDYEFDFGDGGVWQRAILMGDKCQPLDFSGVIYYDESGKQLNHVPLKSPRTSPLPGYLARLADCDARA